MVELRIVFPTPCLKALLFLFALMFPSAFVYFVREIPARRLNSVARECLPLLLTHGGLILVGVAGGYFGGIRLAADWYWVLIGIAAGLGNIALEYFLAALPRLWKGLGWPDLRPTSIYVGAPLWTMLLVASVAISEELVYRGIIMGGLFPVLGMSWWIAVPASSLIYAMNHAVFGRRAIFLKVASGLVIAALFALSGGQILVPVLAHVTQNLMLFFHAQRASRFGQLSRKGCGNG